MINYNPNLNHMQNLTKKNILDTLKWGQVGSVSTGIRWAAAVALASAVPTELYAWVYGTGRIEVTVVDALHLLLGHSVAGAILGGWK